MDLYIYILAVLGGLAAGFINTLAGSGSIITLPILIFLGLPAGVANATNRLGVLLQTLVSVITLKKRGQIKLAGSAWLIIPATLGAIPGAIIAVDISDQTMKNTIATVLLLLLIPVLMNNKKWLREKSESESAKFQWYVPIIFFLIGCYGGFLQAGVGIFLLLAMVLMSGFNLPQANALKNLIVFCFSIPAVLVFLYHEQINWEMGLLVASGQMIGAWIASRFAIEYKKANLWIRRLLVVVIIGSAIKLFDLFALLD